MIQKLTPQGYNCWIRPGYSDEKVFKEIFETKIYDKPKLGFEVLSGEVWLDMGANCGHFSHFALERGAKVLAIDADYENQDIIEKLGSYPDFLGLQIKAVVPDSFQKPSVTFHKRMDKMTWKSSLFKVANSRPVSVETIGFGKLIKEISEEQGVQVCIKMDIEGAEIPILIEEKKFEHIKKMVFEWSFDKEPRLKVLRDVIVNLKEVFPNVYCPQKIDGIHQTWRGAANQFALVYCF